MGKAFTDFAYGIGGQAVGAGMGLLLGEYNDRRQREQQAILQAMQIRGQKEMTDYNMAKQLEMWKNTSYGAQVREMLKAGINPGLLYGMSGGGGQTTGSATGSVTGASAPTGGREIPDMMGMGIQYQLLKAQKENIEADTKNKLGDAANKPIVGEQIKQQISESQKRIEEIATSITNKDAQTALLKVNSNIANMELAMNEKTFDARADKIEYEARQAFRQVEIADQHAYIAKATRNDVIAGIQQDAINKVIQGALMQAQIAKTGADIAKIRSDIRVNEQQITKWVNEIMIEWDKMTQENQRLLLQKIMTDYNTDPVNEILDIMQGVIGGIIGGAASRGMQGNRTIIEGFKKR